MIDEEQFERLRLARDRVVALIDDPKTPAYSIAPLTNQLRLLEKQMYPTREEPDEGLPDIDQLGLVDLLGFRRHLAGPYPPSRLRPDSGWMDRQAEIFEGWRRAGFVLTPQDDARASWVEANRERLIKRLDEANRKETTDAKR